MFEATKARILAETQENVSRIHSAVRTRLSSLTHRVSSLETELRFKAQVVQVLESRIAELERSLPQPDHVGDLQHAGQEEPGPPAQVHHLLAIEGGQVVAPTLEEHVAVVPTPEDVGEAAPTPERKTSVNNTIAGGLGAGFKCSPERKISLEQTSVNNSIASLGQQTLVNNSIASPSLRAGYERSSEQTSVSNSIASPGLRAKQRAGYERSLEQTSSEPLSIEDLSVLQQRLSSKFLAESLSTSTHIPQLPLNLSATPTRVIRRVQDVSRRVQDEVKETEARIKSLGGPASQQQI